MDLFSNGLNSAATNLASATSSMGRAALHALYPDEIEYYLCSLELIDSSGITKGYMTFTVMPNNVMDSKTQVATITKTNTGITTLFSDSFSPRDISLQGCFGRKLRLVTGVQATGNVSTIPFFGGNTGVKIGKENLLIKTGFGLLKMMENILESAWKLDDKNKPHILIFNNYALNSSYVVEPLQQSFSQGVENNMLWFYSVELKAVADGNMVKSDYSGNKDMKKFLTTVASSQIAKLLNNLVTSAIKNYGMALKI